MAEEPAAVIDLLRTQKAQLIEILSAEADFVLQHADSRSLLSHQGYRRVKACRIPSDKVTELLDHIIQRGPVVAQGLLELLNDPALQEAIPMLCDMKELQVNAASTETATKRKTAPDFQETTASKRICNSGSRLVTEKQLMTVARTVGRSWKEIGRLALDVPSVRLEEFEEDNSLHVERVFAMLCYWRRRQREKATAALLHSCLCQDDWALPPESIDFLLETE